MEDYPKLIISETDILKINNLLRAAPFEIVEKLEEELLRAHVVPETELPENVVSMNSKITFLDLDTGATNEIELTFPHEANIEAGKISILAPVGAALIGLSEGQEINWPLPNNKNKHLKVVKVSR